MGLSSYGVIRFVFYLFNFITSQGNKQMDENKEQKEFWNDLKGELWVELQTRIDPMLSVFDQKLKYPLF